MLNLLESPFDSENILLHKNKIHKLLIHKQNLTGKRICILSGSTIGYIKNILELFLLKHNIKPEFLEGNYANFYEDVLFDFDKIKNFAPDFVLVHATVRNIEHFPEITDSQDEVKSKLDKEMQRFKSVWDKLNALNCVIIQNNFELPDIRSLGNADSVIPSGKTYFINRLNICFSDYAQKCSNFYLNDINYLAAEYGLTKWHNLNQWYLYKYAFDIAAIPAYCNSVASIIKSTLGKNKKAIILDLDNTLWGGIVGDDGFDGIEIGSESAKAESYIDFQKYLKELKNRGIVLAISSKNDPAIARQAFEKRDMPLKFDDFIVFKANWDDKTKNISEISNEINLTLDSFVFIDDNPAERELVKINLPDITSNNDNDISTFIRFIDKNRFFEPLRLTAEDLKRQSYYKENKARTESEASFVGYSEYLKSLELEYSFDTFNSGNLERVTQLINKTNQFNLTTKRLTLAEVSARMNGSYLNIIGSLKDKFGDNGLITVFSGKKSDKILHIDLWLMSCRVFKRDMEFKLFEYVIEQCKKYGISVITGEYIPTPKNAIVADLYPSLGFESMGNNKWEKKITG